jgi:hypothetical protein
MIKNNLDDIILKLEDLANSWEPEDGFPFAVLLERVRSGEVKLYQWGDVFYEIDAIREEFGRNHYYKGNGY